MLRRILDTPGGDADRRKASVYYAACLDEPAIEAKGTTGLQPELARIDRLKSRDELPALVAHLQDVGVNVLFRFRADTDRKNSTMQIADVDQGGLGLPDRDYYLKTDPAPVELRTNLRDWWTAADGKAFEERASCIADQYSQYVVPGDVHINGRLTLGENTADNGGLRLALMAYLAGPGATEKNAIDGFTPEQRVFLGWAQVWCENSTPEFERLKAATNPHSSNMYRANGVVSNMPEFQKAFSCKPDAPMVRQNVCRVW